ncbi:MAG: hypothetical protein HPY61_10990 [Methanotrichaceae archaeon]|nr:hypothetical protein [Methanotrichaceae archaeon]
MNMNNMNDMNGPRAKNQSLKRPGLSALLLLLAACAGASICCADGASPQDVIGTWDVLGELVTSPAEDPADPYAPKPGDIKPDTWTIADYGQGPVLTGSSGSIAGQYTENGALFEGTYDLGSAVYMVVRINCILSSSGSMYGTNENEFWGLNTVTGEFIKTGLESWKFKATKV